MKTTIVALSISALLAATSIAGAQTQQNPAGARMQTQSDMMQRRSPATGEMDRSASKMMGGEYGDRGATKNRDRRDYGHRMPGPGMMGGGMMGGGMMGPGFMGGGMMGPGMMGSGMMMTMMMAMMDTDGDGALSLEEVQAVHARMFKYVDADGDGKLSPDELRGFFHGDADDRETEDDD